MGKSPAVRQLVWRRCNECKHIWFGSKSVKNHWNGRDKEGKKIYCGAGRLIRYPEHDAEVQQVLAEASE